MVSGVNSAGGGAGVGCSPLLWTGVGPAAGLRGRPGPGRAPGRAVSMIAGRTGDTLPSLAIFTGIPSSTTGQNPRPLPRLAAAPAGAAVPRARRFFALARRLSFYLWPARP